MLGMGGRSSLTLLARRVVYRQQNGEMPTVRVRRPSMHLKQANSDKIVSALHGTERKTARLIENEFEINKRKMLYGPVSKAMVLCMMGM